VEESLIDYDKNVKFILIGNYIDVVLMTLFLIIKK